MRLDLDGPFRSCKPPICVQVYWGTEVICPCLTQIDSDNCLSMWKRYLDITVTETWKKRLGCFGVLEHAKWVNRDNLNHRKLSDMINPLHPHIPGTPSRDEQMSKIYLHTYVGALRSDWLPLWLIRDHHQRSCKLSSPVNHLIRAHSWLQKHWLTLPIKRELLSSHCWVLVCDITEHLFFQCKLPQGFSCWEMELYKQKQPEFISSYNALTVLFFLLFVL